MKRLIAIAPFLITLGMVLPVRSQSGQLINEGCRQGTCWETYLLGQQIVHQNRLGGVVSTLREVNLETHSTGDSVRQRSQWVYCSTEEPFVAFEVPFGDDELMYLHYINPGGNQLGSYNSSSHSLYWGICHDLWDAEIWSPENGLAQRARELGYSLNLWEGQREIPKVMFQQ
ncbi:MAG: hypothetical protein ACFB8W_19165 [Elainellaceae cyanobacterium]